MSFNALKFSEFGTFGRGVITLFKLIVVCFIFVWILPTKSFADSQQIPVLVAQMVELYKVYGKTPVESLALWQKLNQFGEESRPTFVSYFRKSENPLERVIALQWLYNRDKSDPNKYLVEALSDATVDVCVSAIFLIKKVRGYNWKNEIISLLRKETDFHVKMMGLTALAVYYRDKDVMSVIQEFAEDESSGVSLLAKDIIEDPHMVTELPF